MIYKHLKYQYLTLYNYLFCEWMKKIFKKRGFKVKNNVVIKKGLILNDNVINIILGDYVRFQYDCRITGYGILKIGSNVGIGKNVQIFLSNHDYRTRDFIKGFGYGKEVIRGDVTIGNNVIICDNSSILPNANIGNDCLIGSSTVVKGNVPDNSVIIGNLGKVVSKRFKE